MTTHADGPTKCPCCDNPWSRATGELFAQMCGPCSTKQSFGLSRSNLDETVDPATDFFLYSNGGWMKNNPIPPGYPSWNTFTALHVQSQEHCKQLLDDLPTKEAEQLTSNERKLAAFYEAAMDEDAIETAGVVPLKPLLQVIDEIVAQKQKDGTEFAKALGTLPKRFGVYPFFSTGPSPDAKNSDHTLCNLSQGGLGLPDRDYYFDEDKADKRQAYKTHMAMMLTLLEHPQATQPSEVAIRAAETAYKLEEQLAERHMTRTECRDPEATYNKMTLADLNQTCNHAFAFDSYLLGSTGKTQEELGDINVRNVEALKRVAHVLSSVDADTLRSYLQWRAVSSCAPYLSKVFVNENFEFYEKVLSGTTELKPRWKRAMAFTEAALGEALGQIYCANYFDDECKTRAVAIVESVRQALEERLTEVEWMSESTREEALKKMSKFRVKIGYPNTFIDYDSLELSEKDEFLSMVFKARSFEHGRETKEMNAPTDREKWVRFRFFLMV